MKYREYKYLVLSDYYRISGNTTRSGLIRSILFGESFKFIFWMRTCRYMSGNVFLKFSLYPLALLMFQHYTYKFGIGIPFVTEIGSGFFIGHFGCIFIYPYCRIGKNCNLSPGVTIGNSNRGDKKGCPTIGNNVYIASGAKIIGAIKIGNNVAIGANCVVTKDIPDNAVVVGIPGRVISYQGSEGYINNTAYEEKINQPDVALEESLVP